MRACDHVISCYDHVISCFDHVISCFDHVISCCNHAVIVFGRTITGVPFFCPFGRVGRMQDKL